MDNGIHILPLNSWQIHVDMYLHNKDSYEKKHTEMSLHEQYKDIIVCINTEIAHIFIITPIMLKEGIVLMCHAAWKA